MERRPPSAAESPSDRRWWLVPLAIIIVVVLAFAAMLFIPFGGAEETRAERREVKTGTIEESQAPSTPAETGTVVDLDVPPTATTTAVVVPPPITIPTTTFAPAPPPPIASPPPAAPVEISESEAVSTLRGYVTSRRFYDVGPECIGITSAGYQNAGYTLEVTDTCDAQALGRWRVDAKTGEVFRQREDGRYLRP
jgi:hypothetical protein